MWGGTTQVCPCPSSPPSHHTPSVLLPTSPSSCCPAATFTLLFKNPLFVSVCCTLLGWAGAKMDLSSSRAWLRACFHFHSMEELLELRQALFNHSQRLFIIAQNRFWPRAWFGAWVKVAEPNTSLSLSPEVSPGPLLTRPRFIWLLGSTKEFSSRKGVGQLNFPAPWGAPLGAQAAPSPPSTPSKVWVKPSQIPVPRTP